MEAPGAAAAARPPLSANRWFKLAVSQLCLSLVLCYCVIEDLSSVLLVFLYMSIWRNALEDRRCLTAVDVVVLNFVLGYNLVTLSCILLACRGQLALLTEQAQLAFAVYSVACSFYVALLSVYLCEHRADVRRSEGWINEDCPLLLKPSQLIRFDSSFAAEPRDAASELV